MAAVYRWTWYRLAADKGHADAQLNMGVMYFEGLGVSKDPQESVKWYVKAAEQGEAMALYNLGQMYLLGQGIPPDRDRAVQWFQKAAKQGFDPAKKKLHYLGLGG